MADAKSVALNILLAFKTDKSGVSAAGRAMDDIGKKAQSFGKYASIALTTPLLLLAKTSVDAASDLNESMNKVDVVFGKSSGVIQDFAKNASTSLGISRQEALESAGTFGNLFTALGLAPAATAKMSTSLVTLASDLASFNNADPSDVLLALRSGLVGEAEPLRKFGVSLSEARIQAEAMALGLVKPIKNAAAIRAAHLSVEDAIQKLVKAEKEHGKGSLEAQKAANAIELAQQRLTAATKGSIPPLTAAQKAQAAYSIIMKDTKTAQGDFSRTSDGLANSQRILRAQLSDTSAEFGTIMLPTVLVLVREITGLARWFSTLSSEQKNGIVVAGLLLAALGPVVGVIGTMITVVNGAATAITFLTAASTRMAVVSGIVRVATLAWMAVQWLLNFALTANPIGLVIVGIAALVAGIIWAYQNVGWFRDAVNTAWDGLKRFGSWILATLKPVLDWLGDRIKDIKAGLDAVGGFLGGNKDNRPAATGVRYGGGRAGGGSVMAGVSYLVGERRPELFTPAQSGWISPSVAGGDVIVNVKIEGFYSDGPGVDRFANQLAQRLSVVTGR